MWVLRKSPTELEADELSVLKVLFKHSPDLKLAYALYLDLKNIFDMKISQGLAKRKIKAWIRHAQKSGLTSFDHFIKAVSTWMQKITKYFVDRLSSGFVDGLNTQPLCNGSLTSKSTYLV